MLAAILNSLAADPARPVDLAEVSLLLSADEYPDLDIPVYLSRLDDFAAAVAPRLVGTLAADVTALARYLFVESGFAGNTDDYYDPRNSYFSDVLDRKLGIPISLAVLAVAVGTRCGLNIMGVGLPGHFIAKAVAGGTEVLFDPFHAGRVIGRRDCSKLVSGIIGQPFAATDEALAAPPPGAVVQRILNNLKGTYLRGGDFPRAARIIERLIQLCPTDPEQRRDAGVSYVHAGQPGRAIDHLRAYLATVPGAADAGVVADFLRAATRGVAEWN